MRSIIPLVTSSRKTAGTPFVNSHGSGAGESDLDIRECAYYIPLEDTIHAS